MNGVPWSDAEIKLLGTATDALIAERIGRTFNAVMKKRQDLKIKSFYRFLWTPAHIRQLGKKPDGVLAAAWGLQRMAIIRKRKKLGIAAFPIRDHST